MLNDKKPMYIRVCERMKCEESKKKGLRLLIFPIESQGNLYQKFNMTHKSKIMNSGKNGYFRDFFQTQISNL